MNDEYENDFCFDVDSYEDRDDYDERDYDDYMDGDLASGLASAGFGTDEDYGYYGDNEDF